MEEFVLLQNRGTATWAKFLGKARAASHTGTGIITTPPPGAGIVGERVLHPYLKPPPRVC